MAPLARSETSPVIRYLAKRPWAARLIVIALLLAVWEATARWFVDPLFLSPPSRVVASFGALFATQNVPSALVLTLWELAAAFLLAVALGLVLGLAIGLQPFVRRSFFPI